jgi:ABC-type dipeptide/oligopeptide/nickel transport system ATPase subunit
MNMILTAENISYSVPENGKEKIILDDLSLTVERNSCLGISGESGSGKTTLGKIIAGIIKPTKGKINFFFADKERRISPVQILFQNTGEIINPLRSVEDILSEAVRIANKNKIEADTQTIIDAVNLQKHLLKRKGYELSGGEQQRTALARILAVKPELLILDEPFSAQDYESQENFLKLFIDLKNKFDITLICIAHNLSLLKKLADEVMIMHNGNIVEKTTTKILFENPQHSYTKFLLKAEKYDLTMEDFKK